jgi:hypothetical protein
MTDAYPHGVRARGLVLLMGSLVAAAALTVALGACGSDDSGSATRSTGGTSTSADVVPSRSTGDVPDACSLLTADEVSQVLAAHNPDDSGYVAQAVDDPGGENDCTIRWTSDHGHDEFSVSVFDASGYVKDPSGDPRSIDGIGDKAFEVNGNYYAQVGDRMVHLVNVQQGEGSDEALLKLAAGRLGG